MIDSRHRVCPSCGAINRVPANRSLIAGRCAKCKAPLSTAEPMALSQDIALKMLNRDGGSFIIDVWADWCGPCHQLAPQYSEAARHFNGKVRFFKVNADESPELGRRLGVRGIPALFLFAGGELVSQNAGAVPAGTLISWIETDLEGALNSGAA